MVLCGAVVLRPRMAVPGFGLGAEQREEPGTTPCLLALCSYAMTICYDPMTCPYKVGLVPGAEMAYGQGDPTVGQEAAREPGLSPPRSKPFPAHTDKLVTGVTWRGRGRRMFGRVRQRLWLPWSATACPSAVRAPLSVSVSVSVS
eukprot:3941919-Rhodomonas_salina.3